MKKLTILLVVLGLALSVGAEEKKEKKSRFDKLVEEAKKAEKDKGESELLKEFREYEPKTKKVKISGVEMNIVKIFEPPKEKLEYTRLMVPQIGRYNLHVSNNGPVYILDTASGRVWVFD